MPFISILYNRVDRRRGKGRNQWMGWMWLQTSFSSLTEEFLCLPIWIVDWLFRMIASGASPSQEKPFVFGLSWCYFHHRSINCLLFYQKLLGHRIPWSYCNHRYDFLGKILICVGETNQADRNDAWWCCSLCNHVTFLRDHDGLASLSIARWPCVQPSDGLEKLEFVWNQR